VSDDPSFDPTPYERLREQYRPKRVRLLLVGESVPDPRDLELRFFYAPKLSQHDNLFRGVVLGIYAQRFRRGSAGQSKASWLMRLRDDGVFLVDAVPHPVNTRKGSVRRHELREHVDDAIAAIAAPRPMGIVICHKPTYEVLAPPIRRAGLPLLHDDALKFPIGNWREDFANSLSALYHQMSSRTP
jgi:hypothetical protein